MADLDLAATGKDTSITITYDGAVVRAYEAVEWTAEPVYETVRTAPLGTVQTHIDVTPVGWKGTVALETSSKDADELLDVIHAASVARVPGILAFKESTRYRDLQSKSYLYADCKILGASKSARRGEATKLTLQWECGTQRVAV